MARDTIRFRRIDSNGTKIAEATVKLFKGVFLKGWEVHREGDEIFVFPPYKIAKGENGLKRDSYLRFEKEKDFKKWIEKVKEEYLKWERGNFPKDKKS